jgi:prepilin signal peptidase PulO-like enzyme (type II secretory pathway)
MSDRVTLGVAAAVAGFVLGLLSAWLTEWLESGEEAAAASATRFWLLKDPLVQAGSALAWVAAALQSGDPLRTAEIGAIGVPLVQVAVTDLRTRYVYTVVAVIGAVIGLALGWQVHAADWWTGLAGAAGGFLAFGALWLLGRLIYRGRIEAMARGDITIAAMVGAGAGVCTPQALFWGVLLGGVFAIGLLVTRRSRHAYMPYGPGLCLGGLATLFLC